MNATTLTRRQLQTDIAFELRRRANGMVWRNTTKWLPDLKHQQQDTRRYKPLNFKEL